MPLTPEEIEDKLRVLQEKQEKMEREGKRPTIDHRIPVLATPFDVEDAIFSRAFAYDTFDRGNSSSIGALESGQSWSEDVGDWEITSNQLNLVADVSSSKCVFPLGYQENFKALTIVGAGAGAAANIGIVFRYSDSDNFLLAQITGSDVGTNGRLRIYKAVGGVLTLLTQVEYSSILNSAVSMTMTVEAHGGIIQAECWETHVVANKRADARAIDPSDTWTSKLKGGLKAGVWVNNNQLDDFRAVWYESG